MSHDDASALSRVLGKGSAHEGAHHWRAQRVSALALIPLSIWFVASLARMPDLGFDTLRSWAAVSWHAVLLAVLVVCIAWHSQLGVQVVVEDYVYGKVTKPVVLLLNAFAHVLLAAVGVFALLVIAFKG